MIRGKNVEGGVLILGEAISSADQGDVFVVDAEGNLAKSSSLTDIIAAVSGQSFDITYNLDGGTNDGANPATFGYADLPITLADATKALNTFDGWFSDAGLTEPVTEITTLGAKTLYAGFTTD